MVLFLVALLACKPTDPRCPEGTQTVCDDGVALQCEEERVTDETDCAATDVCVDGVGCEASEIALPEAAVVPVDLHPITEWSSLTWAALPLDGVGTATLQSDGPFTLHHQDGTEIDGPVTLPGFVWVRATGGGDGTLTASLEGSDLVGTTTLRAARMPGLSVVQTALAPGLSYVDAFPVGSTLRVGLDPRRYPQLIDIAASIYVVEDRTGQEWLDDPTLVDVGAGPTVVSVVPGGMDGNFDPVWTNVPTPAGVVSSYDIVVDVDGDGTLSPGDLLDGRDGPGFSVFPNLTEAGTHAITMVDLEPTFFRTQRIWWPTDLANFDQPAPLVVISHGNGHEHTWYDYLGEHLASWGYVVMSHRNDTEPGVQAAAQTTLDNTDIFLSNREDVDPALANVDPSRVAFIGHSRGAEGVVIAQQRLRTGTAQTTTLTADSVRFISSIAPTVFTDPQQASAGEVPFHILSGSADGDVTGGLADPLVPFFGCALCQSWRLLQGSEGAQVVTYLQGATHNDFNCCGLDDGAGIDAPKIGRPEAQAYARGQYVALLGHFVREEPTWHEFFSRMPDDLAPSAPGPIARQFRVAPERRVVLDDFQGNPDPLVSSQGTAVRFTVSDYAEGAMDDTNVDFTHNETDPMNGMTQSDSDTANVARGAVFGWTEDASWEVDVPDTERDFTGHEFVALRVAQVTRHPHTVALDDTLSFGIALVDGDGVESVLETAGWGQVTSPYPRTDLLGEGTGWANEFNTVRIRLTDFDSGALDLSDVRTVRLRFGLAYGSPTGQIGIDDLALEN